MENSGQLNQTPTPTPVTPAAPAETVTPATNNDQNKISRCIEFRSKCAGSSGFPRYSPVYHVTDTGNDIQCIERW